jgi:hypothetical protein
MVMNKLNLAVLALVFAVLGGCATTPGGLVGTGGVDTYDAAGPFPTGNEAQADG